MEATSLKLHSSCQRTFSSRTASIPRFYFYKKIKPPILILHIRKEKRRKTPISVGGREETH
jgi:hypothetical protein